MLHCWQDRCGHCGWLASSWQPAKVMHNASAVQAANPQHLLTYLLYCDCCSNVDCCAVCHHYNKSLCCNMNVAVLTAGMLRMQLVAGTDMTSTETACEWRCQGVPVIGALPQHPPPSVAGEQASECLSRACQSVPPGRT